VTKRYTENTRPALADIDIDIAPGESVALVGPSGGGKTTLVNLIPRFYLPSAGRVLLDGQDLATIRLADLRRQIALVSQEIVLFNDTIAANIAYGAMADATTERSSARRWRRMRSNSSGTSRKASPPSSASAASGCRAASGNASRSRARSSRTRRY
jgi:ABC-type transport system involved in Fe-S cluster assembly fused permease/ATPase subunit